MKTRWESFVFILLMLLPAICLLNTGMRPDASVPGKTISQPCSSGTTSERTQDRSEHDYDGARPHKAADSSPSSSHQSATGKIPK